MKKKRLLIISGLSGSGKSSAARALEDEGFFVVDNLPMVLLPDFLALAEQEGVPSGDFAVVIDVRNRGFLDNIESTLQELTGATYLLEVYFLESTDETLIRRYSETRRRHPLAGKGRDIPRAIAEERRLLSQLRERATVIIDSTGLTPHQLRNRIIQSVRGEDGATPLEVRLQSFGYRYGVPLESDLVIDVRFLPNPHFVPDLRPLTGLNRPVRNFVSSQKECKTFLNLFEQLLNFLLPQYIREGKSYLTVSVGCTGGRHRSVSIVELLRDFFVGQKVTLDIIHRDIDKS